MPTGDAFPHLHYPETTLVLNLDEVPPLFEPGARTLDLHAPWADLPPPASERHVALGHLANDLSMIDLRRFVHRASHLLEIGGEWEMVARHPDRVIDMVDPRPWAGERVDLRGRRERYRPLRHYLELARLFPCELRVPTPLSPDGSSPFLELRGERLDADPPPRGGELEARYGTGSAYRRFDRLEEPEIVDDLLYAFARLHVADAERVLSLGVNDGRELRLLDEVLPAGSKPPERWGIDGSATAIDAARRLFPRDASRFLCRDLAELGRLELPRFEVVLLLGVVQSRSVDRDRLLADLKNLLTPSCRLLMSIPNCHFGAHDIRRRPLRRDDPRHDRSLVWKDIRYLARWCHRTGFDRVETFGTYDAFLLARREIR